MSYRLSSVFASLPSTTRSQPIHLGFDPKEKNFLYTSGRSVIIRDLDNPQLCEIYDQHSCNATVARYSPSGFYIASADASGKVRIWDATPQSENILKYEYRPLSGAIKDLQWSEDGKRIVVCGEGREQFASVFLWDTGSSIGELSGHSKMVNSCDFKQTRPYRIVTAGEDCLSGFYEGPPFKYQFSQKHHQRFVNCVRFSRDGKRYISCGSDSHCFLYDGKDGRFIGKLGGDNNPHQHRAGVLSCCWSPDGCRILTASADKTCKVWDVERGACVSTFGGGESVEDQQVGCLWQGQHLISVSFSGFVNYWDANRPAKPHRILYGHNKAITCVSKSSRPECAGIFYSASYEGRIVAWDAADVEGANWLFSPLGGGHSNQITWMESICGGGSEGEALVSTSMDDTMKVTLLREPGGDGQQKEGIYNYSLCSTTLLDSMPTSLGLVRKQDASGGWEGLCVVCCLQQLVVFCRSEKLESLPVDFEPHSVQVSPRAWADGVYDVLVASRTDASLWIYQLVGGQKGGMRLVAANVGIKFRGSVTACKYSLDGRYLAVADTSRNISLFNVSLQNWFSAPDVDKSALNRGWVHHSARINHLDWSPTCRHLVSCSLDGSCIVWGVEAMMKLVWIKPAHCSSVTWAVWMSEGRILSAGDDCTLKLWEVTGMD